MRRTSLRVAALALLLSTTPACIFAVGGRGSENSYKLERRIYNLEKRVEALERGETQLQEEVGESQAG